jgi:hypothetical protein
MFVKEWVNVIQCNEEVDITTMILVFAYLSLLLTKSFAVREWDYDLATLIN